MTLQELFRTMGERPQFLVAFFAALPLLALILGALDRDRGHYSPWRYLFPELFTSQLFPGFSPSPLTFICFCLNARA